MITEYIRSKDASKIMGVSNNTIRNWANSGQIPSYKKGKTFLFLEEELRKAIIDDGKDFYYKQVIL